MSEVLPQCKNLVVQHLSLPENDLSDINTSDELHRRLTQIIGHLLEHGFQHLLNVLYKIDLDEKTVKEILALASPNKIAKKLAQEVIKRELIKIKSRQRYKNP